MIVKKIIQVQSLPLLEETAMTLYPQLDKHQEERETLLQIIRVLQAHAGELKAPYTFLIEKCPLRAFLNNVNAIYHKYGHEGTGLMMGYYFHLPDRPEVKLAVVTDYLPALTGKTSNGTCEVSLEDMRQMEIFSCEHNKKCLSWWHTHPFGIPLFFSSTDSGTLRRLFHAAHQMCVVCDNTKNTFMGFKIVDGEEVNESVFSFDLKESVRQGCLVSRCLYQKPFTKELPPVTEEAYDCEKDSEKVAHASESDSEKEVHAEEEHEPETILEHQPQVEDAQIIHLMKDLKVIGMALVILQSILVTMFIYLFLPWMH